MDTRLRVFVPHVSLEALFEKLTECDEGSVLLGNNKACKIKGIESLRIRMHDRVHRLVRDVRYVLELKRNLIFLGTLDAGGYSFKFENGQLRVSKESLIIMKAIRKNSLHVLRGSTIIG